MPFADPIFPQPGQGVNMNLLRGGEGFIAFKGTIRKILKVSAALSLGLIYALITLAIRTFLMTRSL
jgi:hypothetical protein